MVAFADPADLSTYVGTTIDTDRASLFIEQAAATIRGWTGQQIDYMADDVVTCDLVGWRVFLSQIPVADVTLVEYLDRDNVWQSLDPTDYSWSNNGVITIYSSLPAISGWYRAGEMKPGTMRVTYSHGFQEIPDDISAVALSVAGRAIANPLNLQGRTVNGVTETYQRVVHGVSNLLDSEEAILARYTRSVLV